MPLLATAPIAAIAAVGAACTQPQERPRTEDAARVVVPLPACFAARDIGAGTAGVVTSLRENEVWRAVFPSFDAKASLLGRDALACNGRPILEDPLLSEGNGGSAWPHRVVEGEAVIAGGPDRLRAAWLRTNRDADGASAGPLALLRADDSTVEVFALGAYRGVPERTHFSLERLGADVVVVAEDDGCTSHAAPCASMVQVYLPRQGKLNAVARFAVERVAFAEGSEPGVRGRVEYRLTASPRFNGAEIRVAEKVVARDQAGRDVRRAELTRTYSLLPDDTMAPSDDTLWWSVYPRAPKQERHD